VVLKQYLNWLKNAPINSKDQSFSDTVKTNMMKVLLKSMKTSKEKTVTGLSAQTEGLLSKAIEFWPLVSGTLSSSQKETNKDFFGLNEEDDKRSKEISEKKALEILDDISGA